MDLRSWTWIQLTLTIVGYSTLVIGAWWFYITRPAHQARARAVATTQTFPGQAAGEPSLVLSGTIKLTGVLEALIGPPALLVVIWWAL